MNCADPSFRLGGQQLSLHRSAEDRRQAFGGGEQIDVLADETGVDIGPQAAFVVADIAHEIAVRHIDEIDRRAGDVFLHAGLDAEVGGNLGPQFMFFRRIEPDTIGRRHIDIDDHRMAPTRRCASPVVGRLMPYAAHSKSDSTGNGKGRSANSRIDRRFCRAARSDTPPSVFGAGNAIGFSAAAEAKPGAVARTLASNPVFTWRRVSMIFRPPLLAGSFARISTKGNSFGTLREVRSLTWFGMTKNKDLSCLEQSEEFHSDKAAGDLVRSQLTVPNGSLGQRPVPGRPRTRAAAAAGKTETPDRPCSRRHADSRAALRFPRPRR